MIQLIAGVEFLKILKIIYAGFDDKGRMNNLKNIFEMGNGSDSIKNIFSVKDVRFYSRNTNILSLFQEYTYNIE
jgi:hypothetical protein